jgi:hypothetical protein
VGRRILTATLALAGVGLALAPGAAGQVPDPREAAKARTVLEQLDAFRRGDFGAAYGFASDAIREQFTLEEFRQMVTAGYAPIARSVRGTVRRAVLVDAGRGLVEVRVEGQGGQTIDALYEMVDEQGQWRINGVLTRPVDEGPTARLALARPPGHPRAGGR